jgi:hypothetical protein
VIFPLRYLFLLLPLAGAAILSRFEYNNYTLLLYLILEFFFCVGLLILLRGRFRDAALVLASIFLCLVLIEAYQTLVYPRALAGAEGLAGSKPILGWGALAPGLFTAKKIDPKTGRVIYDTTYTITDQLLRKTVSADNGPTVAFFGDSFMFGEGLSDSDTLPQIFSDLEDRKFRVLNLAFSGYGPQQFLRALETRMYDGLLQDARLFVFETAAWHAERTACTPPFTLRAPRYVLENDRPVYVGACAEGITRFVREILGHSAAYRTLVQPVEGAPSRADIDLYIAVVRRAVTLARETYHVPTVILYLPYDPGYLAGTGYTDREIMAKLRESGAGIVEGLVDLSHPEVALIIPGDGHPTGAANRQWAEKIKAWWERHAQTSPAPQSHSSAVPSSP